MKRLLSFMMLLAITATVLCGCGDGTDVRTNGESSSDSVFYGGHIVVGITQDLDSLDPHKAVAAGTKEVLYNIFEGLVKVGSDGSFIPAIASAYRISDDGMTYSFTLREGVSFHNGKTVTADDVVYSIRRVAGMAETSDPEVTVVSAFSIISDVHTTEDGIEVVLSEPNTELMGYFTCSIIPCDYAAQETAPVGTGPFRFVSYEPLGSIVLEANRDYYVEGVPYLDGVTFKICANIDSAFMELLGGSIDVFPYLTNDQVMQLAGRFDIMDGTMNLVQALFLNNAVAPFDDVRVRQAMCYAIDRQAIIDVVAGGRGEVIGTNMFPSFTQYYDGSLKERYSVNAEKAKQLLNEAGYPDGFAFTISVPSNYDFHVRTAQVIAEQLSRVGITAKIKLVEWATWLSDIYVGRQYEATIIGLDSQLAPSDVLRFYPSDASRNFINFRNTEFDRLYAEAINTVDAEAKAELYRQCERILTEDAASVYLQSPAQLVAVNKHLGGYSFYPVYVQDMSTIFYRVTPP